MKIIKSFLNQFKIFYKKNFKKFNGLKNLDKKMLEFINFENGYYVEIGAHDGISNSNTYFYEKYKYWKGILIEPSFNFNLLLKNRSKSNFFFNFGCSDFDSERETILLNSDDYSICKELVDKKYFNWHLNKQILAKKKMIETKIKLKTLNSLLEEANSPNLIDFFSLDVEGMEIKVLKGIDFDRFNFKFLLVECSNKEKFDEVFKFLTLKNIHL
jgi:FkbM family methyltransferase